jgi:hypothetical protein
MMVISRSIGQALRRATTPTRPAVRLKHRSLAELKPAPLPALPAPTNKLRAVEYPAPAALENVPPTTARAVKEDG